MAGQLLSTDPTTGRLLSTDPAASQPIGAHPEARMGAADNSVPGMAWPADPNGVTLQDLRHHPVEAMQQIGANVKQEASDPRTWLALAAGYFGPKAFPLAKPLILRAANSPAVRTAAAATVKAGATGAGAYVGGPGGAMAGSALGELAAGLIRPSAAAAAPEVVSAPGYPRGGTTRAPAMADPVPAAAPVVDEFTAARTARAAELPPAGPVVKESGKMRLTAPEMKEFSRLTRQRGMSLDDALAAVKQMRALAAQLGGATDAEVAAAVKHRGITGSW